MYSKDFCTIYNEFGWNGAPEAFAEKLFAYLEHFHIPVHTALDLGCGTGVLCKLLHEYGIACKGVDLSENMIRIAREQFPQIPFEVGNMITYTDQTPYDLITSTEDAVNHILNEADLSLFFHNAYRNLAPGGLFIFDLLKEDEIALGDPIEVDYDEKTRLRFHVTKAPDGVLSFRTAVFENDVLQFEELIHEIYHDTAMVQKHLEDAGFTVLSLADSLLPGDRFRSTCWYVIAMKPRLTAPSDKSFPLPE